MKNCFTTFLLFASFVLFHENIWAQGFYQVTSPNGVDVWAVGNGGRVFRSYDGGNTYGSLTLGASTLRSIAVRGDHIWIVGDSGRVVRSTDGGVTWNSTSVVSTRLWTVFFLTDSVGFTVGDGGTILRTSDGGGTWMSITSPVTANLREITFADSLEGWIAGDSGTIVKSSEGGLSWVRVLTAGVTKDLFSIAAMSDTVVVTGTEAAVAQSLNGGASWTPLNFKIESKSDVNKVILLNSGAAVYCGGGGFIRKTTDGGNSFSFQKNPMLASLYDVFFYDEQNGWACSEKTNAIIRTTDGGSTWVLPSGTAVNSSWTIKESAGGLSVRGNTFAINGLDRKTIYNVLGNRVYVSHDIGETWTQIATIPGGTKANSFYVSPMDTNLFVAAFGSPDVITRSTNRGTTWTTTLARAFTEYGMPLEMDPKNPNTLYFGPEDGYLYRSQDFGATWDTLSRPRFRSPCDLVVIYEVPSVLICGDGITGSGNGSIYRSLDGGMRWDSILSVSGSEVPTIGSSWINNGLLYATAWGSGGILRSTTRGKLWQQIQETGSTWGVDIARDDPNVAMYGVYGGATSYLTTDGGQAWVTAALSGSNYAILGYDRATFLAQQSGGIYKYQITYTVPVTNLQTIAVVQPTAGTVWQYNTTQDITWNSGNIANVKIEYKTSPGSPWQTIINSTPASTGSYSWLIPNTPTTEARVRISDASDGVPADSSGLFSITSPAIAVMPSALDFGVTTIGMPRTDTLHISNNGTATLVISSVAADSTAFVPGRTSFSIPPGGSDTLSVTFIPSEARMYRDTLRIMNNSLNSPLNVPLSGIGSDPVGVAHQSLLPAEYALNQNYPNPFNPTTRIGFDLPKASSVTLKVYNTLGQEVRVLLDALYPAGKFHVQFDGSQLPSGLYFYRFHAIDISGGVGRGFLETKRMMLVK